MATVYTLADCQKHAGRSDCWLVINGKVYDVSQFMDEHPGGDQVIISAAGKDATEDFEDVGHSDEAREIMQKYVIGDIDASTLPLKQSQRNPSISSNESLIAERNPSEMLIKVLQFLIPLTILALAIAVRYLGSDDDSKSST